MRSKMSTFQLAIQLLRDAKFTHPNKMVLVVVKDKGGPPSIDLRPADQLANKIGKLPPFNRKEAVFLNPPSGPAPSGKLDLEQSLGSVLKGREFTTDIILYVCEDKLGPGGSWLVSFADKPSTFYDAEYFSRPALRAAAAFVGANTSARANRFAAGLDPY